MCSCAKNFSEDDDRAHIRDLLRAFKDPRYITIDGRPLMLIYRPTLVPDLLRTSEIWRQEVQKAGFPDLYLCWVESWGAPPGGAGPKPFGLDASVGFMPVMGEQLHPPLETLRGHRVLDYQSAVESALQLLDCPWKRFPSVMVGWDNTARRAQGATIFHGATPALYEHWLRVTAASLADVRSEENYLFILAWNEWAEGNHLEPDLRYGRAFLEATRSVLVGSPAVSLDEDSPCGPQASAPDRDEMAASDDKWNDRSLDNEIVANVAALLTELELPTGRPVVDLADHVGSAQNASVERSGIEVVPVSFQDVTSLKENLDGFDEIAAVLLVDVLQHLADPQELLAALAAWSLDHGSPPLLVTVPNVAHVDMALQLLCGQFEVEGTGALDPANLRFFTEDTLQRLVERSGWRVVGRDDLNSLFSEEYDEGLRVGLPEELVAALQATAQAVNPNWSVSHFVWALEPCPPGVAPSSYAEAVAPAAQGTAPSIDPAASAAVADYLASVGLVVSETNRRAVIAQRSGTGPSPSLPKQMVLGFAYGSPRRAAAFKRLYERLR